MAAEAPRVVHVSPGRVRVKVPHAKHNPAVTHAIHERLAAAPGISHVETNLLTGSVLILFEAAEVALEDVMPGVAEALGAVLPGLEEEVIAGLLHPSANGSGSSQPLAHQITGLFGGLDRQLGSASGGTVDLRVLLPLSLFFLGMGRLVMAETTAFPSWSDLLWFSFGTFVALNPARVTATEPVTAPKPVTATEPVTTAK
jgi:hypothetical protein